MKKIRDLTFILLVYVLAFAAGVYICSMYEGNMMILFAFDTVTTVVVFIFSVLFHNSSVYDAYWSVAPIVMIVWLYAKERATGIMQLVFLAVFLLWAVRLTKNWVEVFTDFSYEDWRYKKFRDETPAVFWPIVNFMGIHYIPTLVVFAGILPVFVIAERGIGALSVFGIGVMLFGIMLEFFADRQMHAFLNSGKSGEVCRVGLWKHSRHPNYLGEISFWVGVYLAMLPYALDKWYYGIGCLLVALLFNVVSIPLMEKRQKSRRPQYVEYQGTTSRLLLK